MTEEIKEKCKNCKYHFIEEISFDYPQSCCNKTNPCHTTEEWLKCDDFEYSKDYITNLQQDLDKANDIIKKDRQFYKCRMDEYAELKKENEELNRMCELYSKSLYNAELTDYKSRCEGTINLIDRTIEIIKQQPTKDDSWILSRLYGFKYALNGSDEKC